MKRSNLLLMIGVLLLISGCTSVKVRPVDASLKMTDVCIQENPKVVLEGFVPMLEREFLNHGISSEVVPEHATPQRCEYFLTYTALRSWDITPYLSHAEIHLHDRSGKEVGNAIFHLRGKGGMAFTKFKTTETKMLPVIEELLQHYRA